MTPSSDSTDIAEKVAEAVLVHPAVLRLHGGEFGTIASHLVARKITGVRVAENGTIEVGVVLRLVRPLPEIVAELRAAVSTVAGSAPVDIIVSDVVTHQAGAESSSA